MSELHLSIVECIYPDDVQDQLFKEQYIFVLCVKEIQDHLLGEIILEETAEKCLLESRKIVKNRTEKTPWYKRQHDL